ncbi:uncharacterized protein LOC141640009 [Silene latifolia]|uniref:uncharacterized protein LOC141640009 n=1 Tax=Silene latifolia TaxID=37657 RepID=UPI003D7853A1
MEFGGSWEDMLDLIEFSYNSYYTSIGMAPFKALYERICKSPISWDDSTEAVVLGPQMWSRLRKYVSDPSHVLEIENIELDESLSYLKVPKEILDRMVRKTRSGETVLLKVIWSNHNVEEVTWEAEEAMKECYPSLFDQEVELLEAYSITCARN